MSNADACKALIDSQAAKGLGKYGVPLERSDATLVRLAHHGAEEMADALAYFIALKTKALEMEQDNTRLRSALSGLMNYIFDVGGFPRFEASHGAAFDAAYLAAEAALRPSPLQSTKD